MASSKRDFQVCGYDVEIITKKDTDSIDVTIDFYKEKQHAFRDAFVLSHKAEPFLQSVVNTLYKCFDSKALKEEFISFNPLSKSFAFQFDADAAKSARTVSLWRDLSLKRLRYPTKEEAIEVVKAANAKLLDTDPAHKVEVQCINAHDIHDAEWQLEAILSLTPGVHSLNIPDLFPTPIEIYPRDYRRIRDFYNSKLRNYYRNYKVFRPYLDSLKNPDGRIKKWAWSKYKMENGRMHYLVTRLDQIGNDEDEIWSNLFQLCLTDVYQTTKDEKIAIHQDVQSEAAATQRTAITDYVDEQSIANFIGLSVLYYCVDRKRGGKDAEHKEEEIALNEVDKYLLSIVMPYFEIEGVEPLSMDPPLDIPINSGLFTNFVEFYDDQKSKGDFERNWRMQINAEKMNAALLSNLNERVGVNVVKNQWIFTDDGSGSFSVREVMTGDGAAEKVNLTVNDSSFESEWAMWKNRGLKKAYPTSKGYWEILDEYEAVPRVPVKHLNVIRRLMEMDNVKTESKMTITIYDVLNADGVKTDEKTGEYVIEYYVQNEKECTVALALKIRKAFHPKIDGNDKIKKKWLEKESCFLYFKPEGPGKVEWNWYDNDKAVYKEYDPSFGSIIPAQIEATYQGVQEYNFPLQRFNRGLDSNDKPKDRLFIDGQLTEFAGAIRKRFYPKKPIKPYVMRFTFGPKNDPKTASEVVNMEQVAVNPSGEKFPRNIRRLDMDEVARASQVELRTHEIGEMEVFTDQNNAALLRWTLHENGKEEPHHFVRFADSVDAVKDALKLWRANYLFERYEMRPINGLREPGSDIKFKFEQLANGPDLRNRGPRGYNDIVEMSMDTADEQKWAELDDAKINYMERIDGISKRKFTGISLQKIQSVISVLKQQIKSDAKFRESADPFIVAFSDADLLLMSFDKMSVIRPPPHWSCTYMTPYDALFDNPATIKRLDSKGIIYDGQIDGFTKNICSASKLYSFMKVASAHNTDSLFLFKRPNSENIYISYNGYTRRLSLENNNEDLYYFLPSFITLSVGDHIAVEPFSYPDSGTVVDLMHQNGTIYYKVRAAKNVYYTMTYHELTHRDAPKVYYKEVRPSLMARIDPLKEITFSAKNQDPSDTSHPLHVMALSLFESSKRTIAAVEALSSKEMVAIQNKLKRSGITYLLFKTTVNESNAKDVTELLDEQKKSIEANQEDPKKQIIYIDPVTLENFESSKTIRGGKKQIDRILSKLESDKLISCRTEIGEEFSYFNLNQKHQQILNGEQKVYVIHIVEKRKLVKFEEVVEAKEDEAEDEDDEEAWLEFEAEEDDQPKEAAGEGRKWIEIHSTFRCQIEYEMEMSSTNPMVRSLEEVMENVIDLSNDGDNERAQLHNWTVDEKRLITLLHEHQILNEFDLSDEGIKEKFRRYLKELLDEPRYIRLWHKFEEIVNRMNDNEEHQRKVNSARSKSNRVVFGVEATRNAVLLQQEYLRNVVPDEEEEEKVFVPVVLLVADAIEELKEKKKNLGEFKDQIIDYFEQNPGIDHDRVSMMIAKDLAVPLADHCGSKKVKGAANNLLKRLKEMIETGYQPKVEISITSLVADTIEELKEKKPKLYPFKDQIVDYFEHNPDIDSDRILNMMTKEFATALVDHCGTKKIKGAANALLKALKEKLNKAEETEAVSNSNDGEGVEMQSMIVMYNPLQSVVVTDDKVRDIIHPVDLYHAAYSKKMDFFFHDFQLDDIYNDWMRKPQFPKTLDILYRQSEEKKPDQNMVNTLATLIRFNKKYEVIMVPSSVTLKEEFLKTKCFAIAPQVDAVAVNRVAFLYKGLFYIYPKANSSGLITGDSKPSTKAPVKNEEEGKDDEKQSAEPLKDVLTLVMETIDELKSKKPKLTEYKDKIIEYFQSHPEIDHEKILGMNTKDLSIPLSEHCGDKKVKGSVNPLLKSLKAKIGPKEDDSKKKEPEISQEEKEKLEKEKKEREEAEDRFFLDEVKFLVDVIRKNIIEDARDWMDPLDPKRTNGLRSIVKRNNRDIALRWIKIGCGSCFLHDQSGDQSEIGPPKNDDFEVEFPRLLREALFICGIDCSIPFNIDKIDPNGTNRCDISGQYMVEPTKIVDSKCGKGHRFDKKNITQWLELVDNPNVGTLKKIQDKKALLQFGGCKPVNVRKELGMEDKPYPENLEIYLPEYCPKFWECVKCNANGAATQCEAQKITMKDVVDLEMKEEMDIPMAIREQLVAENDNRYERLRLVNDYHQLQEWMTAVKGEVDSKSTNDSKVGSSTIRDDYRIENVVDRNPQYAKKVSDVLADKGDGMELTLGELIKKYPQIELDMAGLSTNQ